MAKVFNPYRYFIVQTSDQEHIDYHIGKYTIEKKSNIIKDFLIGNFKNKKDKFEYRQGNYLVCYNRNYGDRYLVLKLGKERVRETYEEGDFDIEDKELMEYPYIQILVDLKKQILLVEHISNIFGTTYTPVKAFCHYLSKEASKYKYTVEFNPMVTQSSFWNAVKGAESIKELSVKLESPNFFEGMIDTSLFLKREQEKYNNTDMEIKLKNKEEGLKIEESNRELSEAIKYAENGGGAWRLEVVSRGESKSICSEENKQIIRVDDDISEHISKEESEEEEIRRIFDNVQDIVKDGENE